MKANATTLTLLGLQERGIAATEARPPEPREPAQPPPKREVKAPGSAPIGETPVCLECLRPLWVDTALQAWCCPSGCARGGFAVVNGMQVRVSYGRRA